MDTQGISHQEIPPYPIRSEIAQFLEQWDKEVEAIQRALHGYAITGRHDFITRRMQSFGEAKMAEMIRLQEKKGE